MSSELWEKGFECAHNILAMGYTPNGSITGWLNEGYYLNATSGDKWDTIGHRNALLYSTSSTILFGLQRFLFGAYRSHRTQHFIYSRHGRDLHRVRKYGILVLLQL